MIRGHRLVRPDVGLVASEKWVLTDLAEALLRKYGYGFGICWRYGHRSVFYRSTNKRIRL